MDCGIKEITNHYSSDRNKQITYAWSQYIVQVYVCPHA